MHTHDSSTAAPAPSTSNLGRLIYRYLKTIEDNHPGIFSRLADKDPQECLIGAGRLFKGLEILDAKNTNESLKAIEDKIDAQIRDKANKTHFQSLKKAIKKMELSLSLKNIESLFTFRNEFIRNLLFTKYNARLDRLLRDKYPDAPTRDNIQNFVFNAILFRCYSHIFTPAESKPKKHADLKQKQKFLIDIYESGLKNPEDILTSIEFNFKEKINNELQSTTISDAIDDNQLKELDSHLNLLPAHFKEIKADYRFALNPALITGRILTHLNMITVKLNAKQIETAVRPLLSKKLNTLIVNFLESNMKHINECLESQLKANALIEALKLEAITGELSALSGLQKRIQDHAPKSSTLAQKRTSIKIINTRKTSQERPPLPTSARVSDLGVFTQQLRETSPTPEPTEHKIKK